MHPRTFRFAAGLAVVLSIPIGVRAQTSFSFVHRMLPEGARRALGDIDGDGDLDLVGARVFVNDGFGRFESAPASGIGGIAGYRSAALGDVDGDGDLDALIGTTQQDRLYLNDGVGTFADVTGTHMPAQSRQTSVSALADLDGDGDLDALLGTTGGSGRDLLYLNGGAGVFVDATATRLPVASYGTTSIALGDVDGDGDVDALFGQVETVRARLYVNDGGATFVRATSEQFPGPPNAAPLAVALGDVDGDGDLDAAIGTCQFRGFPAREELYLNDGTGVFTDATSRMPSTLSCPVGAAFGDVDVDGDLDLLFGDKLFVNDGSGSFTDESARRIDSPRGATEWGDLDGDGDLDAVGPGLYLNDGGGVFTDAVGTNLPAWEEQATSVAMGDVDADGDVDMLLGFDREPGGFIFPDPASNRLLLNEGTGVFRDGSSGHIPATRRFTYAVALGDVDGDGDLDALIGNGADGLGIVSPSELYLNAGPGEFTDVSATHLPSGPGTDTRAIAFGDVDGDGDLDVFLGNWGQDNLFLNSGAGVFSDATANLPALFDLTASVVLVDVDGDGDRDAFLGRSTQDRLYLNDGLGTFTDETGTRLPVDSAMTVAVAAGDVDGDGDVDLMTGRSGGSPDRLRLYRNDGSGVFSDVTTSRLPASPFNVRSVYLVDGDGDGDLDAWIGAASGGNELYENDGSGTFVETSTPVLSGVTGQMGVRDLDDDGDIDAAVIHGSEPVVVTNVRRQLAWRSIPRVGKPLPMDVYGSAGAPYVVFVAAGTGAVPTPFGIFRLAPSTTIALPAGSLDPSGRAELRFAVPADPALIGVALHWQALAGSPLRLTSLETTALTGL